MATRDRWTAITLLVLAGLYLWGTFQYPGSGTPGMPSARTFPLLLDGALVALSVTLLATAAVRRAPSRATGREPHPTEAADDAPPEAPALTAAGEGLRRLGKAVVLLLAYLLVLSRVGFVAATLALGVALQVWLFGTRWPSSLLWSALLVAGAYWLFAVILQVPLP